MNYVARPESKNLFRIGAVPVCFIWWGVISPHQFAMLVEEVPASIVTVCRAFVVQVEGVGTVGGYPRPSRSAPLFHHLSTGLSGGAADQETSGAAEQQTRAAGDQPT